MAGVTLQYVRESNLIEGIDSAEEDNRSLRAWKWLFKQEAIVPSVILELHRRITMKQLGDNAGQYRKVQVWVGNHTPPPAIIVEQLVYDWCMNVNYTALAEHPKAAHIEFEKIHPFIDGNGRTGRMLMWYQEIVQLNRKPTLLLADKRKDYYKWFRADDALTDLELDKPESNTDVTNPPGTPIKPTKGDE